MKSDLAQGRVQLLNARAEPGIGRPLLLLDLPLRVPHAVLALLLGAGSVFAMVVPFKDMKQTVRFYTGESVWQEGEQDAREIRAAVGRYSTPRDLFVMSGSNPALLTRALRVGFADDPGLVAARGPAFYAQRGARFFMNAVTPS